MRVIDDKGEQLGIMPTHEAMSRADELGLQLVEVNPKTVPPVCKIMDYGKFKYETAKRDREAKKHQKTTELKEVKFRPKTHDHDFDFCAGQIHAQALSVKVRPMSISARPSKASRSTADNSGKHSATVMCGNRA